MKDRMIVIVFLLQILIPFVMFFVYPEKIIAQRMCYISVVLIIFIVVALLIVFSLSKLNYFNKWGYEEILQYIDYETEAALEEIRENIQILKEIKNK